MENNGIYTEMEDNELVILAKKDNESAISQLLKRYIPLVGSRASVFTSSGFEYDDMFQEGMIGLYGAIRSFDASQGAPFSAFARLCIDRMLVAVLRASSRKRRIPHNKLSNLEDNVEIAERKFAAGDPEAELIAKEDFIRFEEKINTKLSAFEYNVLTAFISGCNYSEISKKLKVEEKAVDNALQRIRRKLRS